MAVSQDNFDLSVYDYTTTNKIKSFDKNDFLDTFSTEKELKKLIKKSNGKNERPTITANKTIDGTLKMRISHQNITSYNYYDNFWWFHWHQQMFMQQQMMQQQMMNNVPKFSPNPEYFDNLSEIDIYLSKKSPEIEFVLNDRFELAKVDGIQTINRDIDKSKYREDNNTIHLHKSLLFKEEKVIIAYFNKSTKEFTIITKPLSKG